MENFPVEVVEKILIYPELSINDVVSVSCTCKRFQDIINDNNTIWRKKVFQRWPQLRNKMNDKQISFHQEIRHICTLRTYTRKLLERMSEKFYRKVELSGTDMGDWDEIIKEKWENCHYLINDLREIVHTRNQIDSIDVVPLTTPGNLTQKYYAAKVLRYICQVYLSRMWQNFISLPPERQLLEVGSVIIAQWCQPKIEIDPEEIYRHLDEMAEMVKAVLKRDNPDHPLFKATREQFDLWRVEVRPDNEWSPVDCRKLIVAMREVLFQHMGFMGYAHRTLPYNSPDEDDTYLNIVLKTRSGMGISLAIIFDAVGRRLGLRCEPINFPSHFLLRFCESQKPDAEWYYIDVFNGGQIVREGSCPHRTRSQGTRVKYPTASTEEVIVKIANDLERLARQAYTPSGRVTRFHSTLELIRLVSPKDFSALFNLARLYMQYNLDVTPLQNFLQLNQFDIPEQALSLAQMLDNYHADPPYEPTEPNKRPPNVTFAVGMVGYHILFGYKCVICNWDEKCLTGIDWQTTNNIRNLSFKENQPFYNVLVEDGSQRYVAQENLQAIYESKPLQLNDEVGRYFSHYYQTHYVPNARTEYFYPEDKAVRLQYHKQFTAKKNVKY